MRCAFCQYGDISQDKNNGIPVSPKLLAAMAWQLATEGCHNINWVGGEPTVHLYSIVDAISILPDFKGPSKAETLYLDSAKSDNYLRWTSVDFKPYYDGELNVPQLCNSNFF
jgi:putative pyruvate formate lyase activating enzyme